MINPTFINSNNRSLNFQRNQKPITNSVFRQQLGNLLFKTSNNISFGWSQNVKSDVEKRILDTLTDTTNKNAVVSAHVCPDGDAYGSLIGIAGILKKMGVNVYPIIDDKPLQSVYKMPSAIETIPAIQYVQTTTPLLNDIKTGKVKDLDLAIITDTSIPELSNSKTIDILAKAKKLIIIDHHPDSQRGPSNRALWEKELVNRGMEKENILYWRDSNRTSASEMTGELDKEIEEEDKNKKIANYDPSYYKDYRIAMAAGICCDAGYDGENISRLSKNTVKEPDGKECNSTTNIFNWLKKNSNTDNSKANLSEYTHIILPEEINNKLDNILIGKLKVNGIEVKNATQDSPIKYIYMENKNALIEMASRVNIPGLKITKNDIYNEIRYKINQKNPNKNDGLLILANKIVENSKKGTISKFNLSLRSEEGSLADGLATKVTKALVEAGIGSGGGHNNATGFRANSGLDFKTHALPVIEKAVKEFYNEKNHKALAAA